LVKQTANAEKHSRRGFLGWAVAAIGGLFSLLVGLPIIGYILSPLGKAPQVTWVRVCSLDEIDRVEPRLFAVLFPRNDGGQEWEERRGVYVIWRGEELLAFTNICTHLNCSVRWIPQRQQIICPCHGGMYDRWGFLAGGPPAYSLPLFEQRIEGNDLYVSTRLVHRDIVPARG
jgi:menaquinol-cytochrome c reductase iron-sulfur subunit